MKMFDLQAAISGEPLITREGNQAVKFLAHAPDAHSAAERLIVLISGVVRVFYESGNYLDKEDSPIDLFMAPKKRTVWVNFYMSALGDYISHSHISEADADIACSNKDRIGGKAYPVEIDD